MMGAFVRGSGSPITQAASTNDAAQDNAPIIALRTATDEIFGIIAPRFLRVRNREPKSGIDSGDDIAINYIVTGLCVFQLLWEG